MKITELVNPFAAHCEFHTPEIHRGRASLVCDLQAYHMNPFQITHGGLIMTFCDVVMAMAARSLHDDVEGVVSLRMQTEFKKIAGVEGQQLMAQARVTAQNHRHCACEVDILLNDHIVATAQAEYKLISARLARKGLHSLHHHISS